MFACRSLSNSWRIVARFGTEAELVEFKGSDKSIQELRRKNVIKTRDVLSSPFKVNDDIIDPANVSELSQLDMMPAKHKNRTVQIAPQFKSSWVTDVGESDTWMIRFTGPSMWKNQMMGWNSNSDNMRRVKMKFKSKNDAIDFAKSQGWEFEIFEEYQHPGQDYFGLSNYADNFLSRQVQDILAEEGTKTKQWKFKSLGKSHWVHLPVFGTSVPSPHYGKQQQQHEDDNKA